MSGLIKDAQVIHGKSGEPAYVIIDYDKFVKNHPEDLLIPHEVVSIMGRENASIIAAWRKYLKLTQAEVAKRMGISQAAYSQQESCKRPRKKTREKIAKALNIAPEFLQL